MFRAREGPAGESSAGLSTSQSIFMARVSNQRATAQTPTATTIVTPAISKNMVLTRGDCCAILP
jgi:hypothetical protein